jgi:hypothetical protein
LRRYYPSITYQVKISDLFDFDSDVAEDCFRRLDTCNDICMIQFPVDKMGMKRQKNIIKYFATMDEYTRLDSTKQPGSIVAYQEVPMVHKIEAQKQLMEVEYNIVEDNSGDKIIVENNWSYFASTGYGDCGALMCLTRSSAPSSRIYGIHVAGKVENKIGHSEFVPREDIVSALNSYNDNDTMDVCLNVTRAHNGTQLANGQFQVVGTLERKVPMHFETKMYHSPLAGCFGFLPLEAPAPLGKTVFNGEKVDPWNHNLKKYCKKHLTIDPEIVKDICDQIYIDLCKNSPVEVRKDILTMEEAIVGSDFHDIGSIPRNTSPGYPDVLKPVKGYPKRTRYFGRDELCYNLDNEHYRVLEQEVETIIANAGKGIRMEHFCIDNLKDETIDIVKIQEKLKSRIFNVYSIQKLTVDKMYFGAFADWITKNKINNGIAIGVNPYSIDWDLIARRLLRFGPATRQNIGAGDYAVFDGSELSQVMLAILENIINKWYGEEIGNRVRRVLFQDIAFSQHVRGDIIYEWQGGNTSGNFLTAILNCLYNYFAFYYAWYRLHEFDKASLKMFKEHIVTIFLGDDNGFSTSITYEPLFTEVYLTEALAEIGLTYTSELKDTVNKHLRKLTDIEFLKRKFVFDKEEHRWIAPQRLICTLETVYWTRKSDNPSKIVTDKIDFLLRELALHGEIIFDKYSNILNYLGSKFYSHTSEYCMFRQAKQAVLTAEAFY